MRTSDLEQIDTAVLCTFCLPAFHKGGCLPIVHDYASFSNVLLTAGLWGACRAVHCLPLLCMSSGSLSKADSYICVHASPCKASLTMCSACFGCSVQVSGLSGMGQRGFFEGSDVKEHFGSEPDDEEEDVSEEEQDNQAA